MRDLASGNFLVHQHNAVLIGGTGPGKTHLAIAIARACIGNGKRGRFFNVVDLVNKLEAEARSGRQGRTADQLCRLDFVALDELSSVPWSIRYCWCRDNGELAIILRGGLAAILRFVAARRTPTSFRRPGFLMRSFRK